MWVSTDKSLSCWFPTCRAPRWRTRPSWSPSFLSTHLFGSPRSIGGPHDYETLSGHRRNG
jgi:hypothetical protein